ncbi:ABC transporter ATP-binding protein [Paenibacillus jiagnxiensis]|uniref:ABC transporter ATP-binding protein n=1 Tax=Paenibacillus jiagnxiensis TaxID=3228926 RepID=UPI0033B7FDD9
MAYIFAFLKKYRLASIVAIFMMLVELSVELLQPWIISRIIDDGIRTGNLQAVWLWGGFLLAGAAVAFAAGIIGTFYASHASQGFAYDLRSRLYVMVQSFSYALFSRFAVSSLITRLTGDVSQLQDTIFMSLRFMSRVPLLVLGSVIMSLVVNVKLGLLLTVTVPVLLVFLYLVMKKASALFRGVQRRLDSVNGSIQENLTAIRLIRVFVRMGHEIGRFSRLSGELMKGTVRALRLTETTMPFILLLMNLAIIAVLWNGRVDIAAGEASVGEVVAVVNYALRTIGALSALSWIVVTYSRAGASAQRIGEVLAAEDSASGYANNTREVRPVQGQVEFHNVGFRYSEGSAPVLEDISFQVRPGERVAIMGATGSGKSSLVQLIPRLYEETEGVVLIDGMDAKQLDVRQLRDAIGYVPQEVLLFSGTIRENIAWGDERATLGDIREAARQAQLHETIEGLPSGYDTVLGQRGINLSGGQKQRLSIARALVRKPSILILDDSTSALDVKTEAALLAELEALSCTTFLITQKISSTMSADLILLLDEGCLIAKGTHEELLSGSELYQRIYQSQFGEEALQHAQGIH